MSDKKGFTYALVTFVGTIIGVGLFGLPYVASRAGFPLFIIYLICLSVLGILVHWFFGEVAVKTPGLHRLPGYAALYFGPGAKKLAFVLQVLSLLGALLAYLVVGGQFLASFFGGSVILYTFIFFLAGALVIWRDTRSIGPIELILLVIFLMMIILFFFTGLGHLKVEHFLTTNFHYFFLPYGVILFSLWGTSIVPDVKEMLRGNRRKLQRLIVASMAACFVVYLIFTLAVIGISGPKTSQEAIAGLQGYLGRWVLKAGFLAGIIATFTSFITLGLTLEKTFWYDYGMPKRFAWVLACLLPLTLFIIGLKDFINIIGLTGAVMLGSEGVLITLMYLKLKKKEASVRYRTWRWVGSSAIVLLLLGVALEVFYFFRGY